MGYTPPTGSTVAFQSQPSSLLVGASIIGLTPVNVTNFSISPSVIAYQLAGSVLAVSGSFSSANPSVTVNNIVTGQSSVQVLNPVSLLSVTQGTSPWVINQPSPSIIAYQLAGSVLAVSGSFSSTNTSVTLLGGGTIYQEKNAVTPSVLGIPILFKIDETNSVLSAVSPQSPFPVKGSVTVLQGTTPWLINLPSPSILIITPAGSVQAVRTDNASVIAVLSNSSVAVLQGTNPWLIGNTSVQLVAGTVAIGSVATLQGTNPWIVVPTSGSIIATQIANSVMGVRTDNASIISVDGVFTRIQSVMSTVPSSMMVGASIIGLTPVSATQITNPWVVNVPTPSYLSIQPGGSVLNANISGSVAVGLATGNSSVQLISTSASIATLVNNILTGNSSVQLISTSASIQVNMKSQFGANNTWTQNNSVLATGALRNDTMSSITTADSTYSPFAVGPIGETIVAAAPITKWVVGRGSVMSGTSIQLLAGPGTSIFTYISGIYLTNESSIATRVTITQGLGAVPASMVTWFVVPAGGGSNAPYFTPLRVLDNLGISASISTVASVYVTITGFTAKT